jgi:Putative lumazine-binding
MSKPPTRSSLKITEWYAHLMNDHDQIKDVIETYFLGQSTGDAIHMRAAFLPTSRIEGIRQEKFTSWTLEEYCAMFDGQPAANEAERRQTRGAESLFNQCRNPSES